MAPLGLGPLSASHELQAEGSAVVAVRRLRRAEGLVKAEEEKDDIKTSNKATYREIGKDLRGINALQKLECPKNYFVQIILCSFNFGVYVRITQ